MPDEARLYVISSNYVDACHHAFGSDRCPSWARIVTEPNEILALPSGARCVGLWFMSRRGRSLAQLAWDERRLRGDLIGLGADEIDAMRKSMTDRGDPRSE